ncbi:MAG: glycosyltransferase family 1 protein [Cytophagales bacterium]|nr:glycosyltransferase family 1 protein [Cytophagales bacterium]
MPNFDRPRVIVDASPLRYLHTGLGQFSYHLLHELSVIPTPHYHLEALVHPRYQSLVPQGIQVKAASWLRRHAPQRIQPYMYGQCRVWHMTTENTRLTGTPTKAALVLTIHGLHFLDEETPSVAEHKLRGVQALVNQAEVITAVSQHTATLVRQTLDVRNKTIRVIPNGISFSGSTGLPPAWAPQKKFLFSVGTFFERKNLHVLIPMMKLLPEFTLILAGDFHHDYGTKVLDLIRAQEMGGQIITPGEISDVEKNWLYENGEALVFPSVSEGFGIPLLEAFHHGKPVFCSRFGSLPEVGKTYAYYWDDFQPEHMASLVAAKLRAAATEEQAERRKYAGQFSWSVTAGAYHEIYTALLN